MCLYKACEIINAPDLLAVILRKLFSIRNQVNCNLELILFSKIIFFKLMAIFLSYDIYEILLKVESRQ